MLNETLRSRWFSACLQAGLWLLLILTALGIGGRSPVFQEAETDPSTVITPVPIVKLDQLFAPAGSPKLVVDSTSQTAFATQHFLPPVTPPPPAPPPASTRRVDITYQGYYEILDGPRCVMLSLGDVLISVPMGGSVTTNLWAMDASFQTLTLTNSAGQTNVAGLNVKMEVEVPIK